MSEEIQCYRCGEVNTTTVYCEAKVYGSGDPKTLTYCSEQCLWKAVPFLDFYKITITKIYR